MTGGPGVNGLTFGPTVYGFLWRMIRPAGPFQSVSWFEMIVVKVSFR
jgi:hypothetical protein